MVNEFDNLVNGFVAVTSKWARLYFSCFFLLGVLLMLNVVIAVMLDSYLTTMRDMERITLLKINMKKKFKRQNSMSGSDDSDDDDDDTAKKSSMLTNCFKCGGDESKFHTSKGSFITCFGCCDLLDKCDGKKNVNGRYMPVRNHDIIEGRDDIDEEEEDDMLVRDGGGKKSVDEEVSPGVKLSSVSRMLNAISVANQLSTSESNSMQERSTLLSEALLTNVSRHATDGFTDGFTDVTAANPATAAAAAAAATQAATHYSSITASGNSGSGVSGPILSQHEVFSDATGHDDDDEEYTSVI